MAFTHIHCCWLTKLIFLLLVMSRIPRAVDTRPARSSTNSDLIAGNEFLKLFMERDELQRELYSAEYEGHADGGGIDSTRSNSYQNTGANDSNDGTITLTKARNSARSLDYKAFNGGNEHTSNNDDNDNDETGKQVVKLVTSGSKIVFLEEYDDVDDAVVDAVARDIDLKREKAKKVNQNNHHHHNHEQNYPHQHKASGQNRIYQESKLSAINDEFKVVAVSVSSSSKRGSPVIGKRPTNDTPAKPVSKFSIKTSFPAEQEHESRYRHNGSGKTSTTARPGFNVQTTTTSTTSTTTTTRPSTTKAAKPITTTTTFSPLPATNDIDDFINRSHKSEFSIEEAEPLTMPQKSHNKMRRAHASIAESANDSENSASSNIQNVLASPALLSSASMRSTSIAMPATSGNKRNSTQSQSQTASRQARINQSAPATYDSGAAGGDNDSDMDTPPDTQVDLVEDKLLPFQTVIYHDHGQEGRGPQSRSISYSSISQNVEDLQAWQQAGILAEAQRNVNESLKPTHKEPNSKQSHTHESEPAKFYSVPAKMYSVPSKFYSEPAKVYSEPAKVYGQPEKFYSEPAKVYGQPSKFYSEPAKVYSQPSKVYGEPAKTYWPQTPSIVTTTTSTSSTTTTMTPSSQTLITTFAPLAAAVAVNLTARRPPAIVSRIAFGETVSSTPAPLPADVSIAKNTANIFQQHAYHQHHTHQSQLSQQQYHNNRQNHQNAQSRRVIFNLDKLPYDLLNAPEQPLLEPDLSKSSQANPCAEANQRQQSSFSDQHSNQNAKGLPNKDLVKCVSKFSVASESGVRRPSSSASMQQHQSRHYHNQHHYTTERSHIEESYQPTPEQNYEIEESVSVMTNGRTHGIHGSNHGGIVPMTMPTTTSTPPKMQTTRQRFGPSGGSNLRTFGHTKSSNEGADAMMKTKTNRYHNNNSNDYNNSDDDNGNDEENIDDINNNGDEDDDGVGEGNTNGDGDDDDSKVGYVVEGRNYRKYRVEEKTDDGFIVGEFGVVDHNDGNLRGVRYTADSNINPSLISKALMAFLKLK